MFITTSQRQLEATDLASSARRFKDQVQRGLTTFLAPQLREGETMPDLVFFQELIGRALEASGSTVIDLDGRQTGELRNAAVLRARRNELAAALRKQMSDVRYLLERSLEGGVVKASLRKRRLSKVKPALLVLGARDLLGTLRDPQLAAQLAGNAVFASAEAIIASLEADTTELEALLAQLSPQKKATQDELGAKVKDLRRMAENNRRCGELLYGLLRVAGEDFHADRLRPKARKKKLEEPQKVTPAEPISVALLRVN